METWRCDACGAYTDEPLQVCSACQARRLEDPTLSKAKKAKSGTGKKGTTVKSRKPRKGPARVKDGELPRAREAVENPSGQPVEPAEAELEAPSAFQPEPPEHSEIGEEVNMTVQDPISTETLGDSFVSLPVEPEQERQEEVSGDSSDESQRSILNSVQNDSAGALGNQISLLYVNTPVLELIKRKIDIDFETFPTVSIGRSPENVVVIPDAGVSRTHAELRKEGNRLILRDLQSSNGTYIYDGKEFRRVEVEGDVSPNSLVKLGTGTILRLVSA